MANEPNPDAQVGALAPSEPRRSPLASFALIALVAGTALFVGRHLGQPAAEPADAVVVAPTPSVVVGLRELARLEGMVVHVERVVDLRERQSVLFDLLGAEDAILLVAGGEVTAGVDLRALSEHAVEADFEARRARVTLPHATVFSRRLDNDRTYVHTRSTDLLAKRREDLESRARKEAERMLETAALDAGILRKAEASVERTVEGLLRSLGFEDVEVRFEDGTSGEARVVAGPG